MWLKDNDYEQFVKECQSIYFDVDIVKLTEQVFKDAEILHGITFEDLDKRCVELYQSCLDNCPKNMSFEEYISQVTSEEQRELRKILAQLYHLNN